MWTTRKFSGEMHFGAKYRDGSSRTLFALDPANYNSHGEIEDAVEAAFAKCGIDVSKMPGWNGALNQEEALREARMEQLHKILMNSDVFGRGIPGSYFYSRHGFGGDVPGSAFSDRDFGSWTHKTQPPNPDRAKAVARCRSLKAMADHPTTNVGERDNARAALERLKAKHSIRDNEIA